MSEPACGPVVAVDVGRTSCRAAVIGADLAPVTSTVTLPSRATLADRQGPERIAEATFGALDALAPAAATAVVVAAAGALTQRAAAAVLADLLAERLPGPVVVASDVVAAHAGALRGEPGVVLAAGTGAVALAVTASGDHTVVDGGGYLIGDAGSGFAIGRAGLAAALRHADGRERGSAMLAAAAVKRFSGADGSAGTAGPGGADLRAVVAALHEHSEPARQVASFVPDVAAAARAGDLIAAGIWRDAVAELAATATAALRPLVEAPVALVGRLFEIEDLLTGPLRQRLVTRCRQVSVHTGGPGEGDVLSGAARLVSWPAGVYESLLVRGPVGSATDG